MPSSLEFEHCPPGLRGHQQSPPARRRQSGPPARPDPSAPVKRPRTAHTPTEGHDQRRARSRREPRRQLRWGCGSEPEGSAFATGPRCCDFDVLDLFVVPVPGGIDRAELSACCPSGPLRVSIGELSRSAIGHACPSLRKRASIRQISRSAATCPPSRTACDPGDAGPVVGCRVVETPGTRHRPIRRAAFRRTAEPSARHPRGVSPPTREPPAVCRGRSRTSTTTSTRVGRSDRFANQCDLYSRARIGKRCLSHRVGIVQPVTELCGCRDGRPLYKADYAAHSRDTTPQIG